MRKGLFLLAAVAALFTLVAGGAQAMPAASLTGAANTVASHSDRTITQVRDGCGRGWHRGRRGHCRRN